MTFDEMASAMKDARRTFELADNHATDLARILVGRLRKVNNGWVLKQLKTELRDLDARSGTFK